jgi:4-hydroxybenzoate polyprenyltransferase
MAIPIRQEADRAPALARWQIFISERFPPAGHLLLITFFFSANAAVALAATGMEPVVNARWLASLTATLCVFLHLRLFDEIKDYRDDLRAHPERPLPRGLITVAEAKRMAAWLIAAELVLGAATGPASLLATLGVVIYSLLMYLEFFRGSWLRPRLATYALTHTVVAMLLSLAVMAAVTGRHLWQLPESCWVFVLANWLIFNIFEFGRKSFGRDEEQAAIPSYSRTFGPAGAAAISVGMAAAAVAAAFTLGLSLHASPLFYHGLAGLLLLTGSAGLGYGFTNSPWWAKLFRTACTIFILVYNIMITFAFLLRPGQL